MSCLVLDRESMATSFGRVHRSAGPSYDRRPSAACSRAAGQKGTMMTMSRVLAVCAACYVAGVLTQAGLAQGKKPAFDPAIFEGSAPAVGTKLLDGALALAEQGSW